jgi:hypothetical protein
MSQPANLEAQLRALLVATQRRGVRWVHVAGTPIVHATLNGIRYELTLSQQAVRGWKLSAYTPTNRLLWSLPQHEARGSARTVNALLDLIKVPALR